MEINSSYKNDYRIIDIKDNVGLNTDLSELKTIVKQYLQENEKNFAFSFTDQSYLSAKSVETVIGCFEMIQEKEGEVAIIHPNEDILSIVRIFNLRSIIKIFNSKEELINL